MQQFRNGLVIVFLVICQFVNGQKFSKLTIIDAETELPIVFANVTFNNTTNLGAVSDIDGFIYINDNSIISITISHLNYEKRNVLLDTLKSHIIKLQPKTDVLDEIIINSNENPAHRIIRNVIANKKENNPLNLPNFTFESYNKIVFDASSKSNNDSLREFFKDKHLFITETVSKHKYLKPNLKVDSVIATRTSGFRRPSFAALAKDFQPFSFYNEHFTLLNITYLNPISNQSFRHYKFRLEEELLQENDTIFIISFQPKKGKNFDGLKGQLHVNSNNYAIQNVEAEPFEQGKTTIKIQQKYKLIKNKHWFPEQLNFEVVIGKSPYGFKYTGKSYIDDVAIDVAFRKRDFPFESLTLLKEATKKSSAFWNRYRTDSLTTKEKRTYVFVDSIGKKYKFDNILKYSESLTTGRLPFNYVDVDLLKLVAANKHEGVRLGLGLYTNDDLIKNVSIGGFFGYGFKDKAWKYGGEIRAKIPSNKDISFSLKYEKNLREVGLSPLDKNEGISNFRNWMAETMDEIEAFSFKTDLKLIRNFYWTFEFNRTKTKPLYSYEFISDNGLIRNYINSEFNADFTYFTKEKIVTAFGQKMRVESDNPVFNFRYSKGFKGVFNSDFSYNKYMFSIRQGFRLRNFGKTNYIIKAKYIDTSVPYGLLVTGEGAFDRSIPFVIKGNFQTMRLYEFLSNASIDLFTTHNFGGLLFKAGRFQPDVILHNNLGYGSLKEASNHQNINFNIKNKIYLETGLELKSLVKINYLNMGYLGLGVGGFYRYGYYNLPKFKDNFAFKFGMSFSIR